MFKDRVKDSVLGIQKSPVVSNAEHETAAFSYISGFEHCQQDQYLLLILDCLCNGGVEPLWLNPFDEGPPEYIWIARSRI